MSNNVNIWQKLKKQADKENRPIFVLAPLANVTDAAFRRVIAKYGKPDAMWTEFVSADGLLKANKIGKEKLLRDLIFTESERLIIAQFFTSDHRSMEAAAKLAVKLGFDGIDINMGCPDRGIEKQGGGAALIKNPKIAKEIIRAAKKGAPPNQMPHSPSPSKLASASIKLKLKNGSQHCSKKTLLY